MSVFEYISVAISIVLGLGLTQILRSLVVVFRARREHPVSWFAVVWAVLIFLIGVQFWWALFQLDADGIVQRWSIASFLFIIALAVTIYLAAAIVLPGEPKDPRTYLHEDGRWVFVALIAYGLMAVFANLVLFGSDPAAPVNVGNYVALVGHAMLFRRPDSRVAWPFTLYYALFMAWAFWGAAPQSY